jgi:hypothetical protein
VSNSGAQWYVPLETPEVSRARRTMSVLERRERFERRHPEIPITIRREGGRLLFEVSAPNSVAVAYEDADAMMDDLEARYPDE